LQFPTPNVIAGTVATQGDVAMDSTEHGAGVKVQFVPVGRDRREWMWKARDESNTITISGHRFDSLNDAIRDARFQISGITAEDDGDEDGPEVA
jgi:hypothetical protein